MWYDHIFIKLLSSIHPSILQSGASFFSEYAHRRTWSGVHWMVTLSVWTGGDLVLSSLYAHHFFKEREKVWWH
jgi:hypothetical protein